MMRLADDALRGSYPPLVVPLRDGEVDYDAYAALVEFHVAHGSHGLVVNGTTGEPSLLSVEERNRLTDVALEAAAGRIPVMVATGSQSHAETIALTRHADEAGCDALLIVTPYYLRPPQRGLVEYFVELAGRTERPVLLYHIPGRAAVGVELATLERIAERAANFVGMKHAVNELALVSDALGRLGPEFRIFVGLEELSFPMLAVGAAGMVNAVGNIVPGLVVQLYEAVAANKLEEARRLHFALWDLNKSVFFDTNPIPVKYMMRRLGILERNEHRLPMVPATPDVERRCDDVLVRTGLLNAGSPT